MDFPCHKQYAEQNELTQPNHPPEANAGWPLQFTIRHHIFGVAQFWSLGGIYTHAIFNVHP
jgi:hypothetical protein